MANRRRVDHADQQSLLTKGIAQNSIRRIHHEEMVVTDRKIVLLQAPQATARQLSTRGWTVHALVRDPDKPAAQELQDLGAVLFTGDLDDAGSLREPLAGRTAFPASRHWPTNRIPSPPRCARARRSRMSPRKRASTTSSIVRSAGPSGRPASTTSRARRKLSGTSSG